MRRRWDKNALAQTPRSHACRMGNYPTSKYVGPSPYMETDRDNQNAAIEADPLSRKKSEDISSDYGLMEKKITKRILKPRKK